MIVALCIITVQRAGKIKFTGLTKRAENFARLGLPTLLGSGTERLQKWRGISLKSLKNNLPIYVHKEDILLHVG